MEIDRRVVVLVLLLLFGMTTHSIFVSSGTNAMAKYMMNNLVIPQNDGIGKGILAQVPWHKHGEFVVVFRCRRRSNVVLTRSCVLYIKVGWICDPSTCFVNPMITKL